MASIVYSRRVSNSCRRKTQKTELHRASPYLQEESVTQRQQKTFATQLENDLYIRGLSGKSGALGSIETRPPDNLRNAVGRIRYSLSGGVCSRNWCWTLRPHLGSS